MDLIAQICGIVGFILAVCSFQTKKNQIFFIFQGLSGLMFFLNFFLIGAIPAALFNFVNLIRGILFSKNDKKPLKLVVVEILYVFCFIFSLTTIYDKPLQIFLSTLTWTSLIVMTVFMWKRNGKHIRYIQFFYSSPAWIVHNIFNFTLGGILCEVFNMTSVVVSFIRFGKDGFEK